MKLIKKLREKWVFKEITNFALDNEDLTIKTVDKAIENKEVIKNIKNTIKENKGKKDAVDIVLENENNVLDDGIKLIYKEKDLVKDGVNKFADFKKDEKTKKIVDIANFALENEDLTKKALEVIKENKPVIKNIVNTIKENKDKKDAIDIVLDNENNITKDCVNLMLVEKKLIKDWVNKYSKYKNDKYSKIVAGAANFVLHNESITKPVINKVLETPELKTTIKNAKDIYKNNSNEINEIGEQIKDSVTNIYNQNKKEIDQIGKTIADSINNENEDCIIY